MTHVGYEAENERALPEGLCQLVRGRHEMMAATKPMPSSCTLLARAIVARSHRRSDRRAPQSVVWDETQNCMHAQKRCWSFCCSGARPEPGVSPPRSDLLLRIDHHLPHYQFAERHALRVTASHNNCWTRRNRKTWPMTLGQTADRECEMPCALGRYGWGLRAREGTARCAVCLDDFTRWALTEQRSWSRPGGPNFGSQTTAGTLAWRAGLCQSLTCRRSVAGA